MKVRKNVTLKWLAIFPLMIITVLFAASCGTNSKTDQAQASGTKLPPGASDQAQADTSNNGGSQSQGAGQGQSTQNGSTGSTNSPQTATTTSTTQKTASLAGVNFTVTSAIRDNNNKVVTTGNQRQISGDYLRVELSIENASSALVDLTNYSFRLWNPAIDASLYYDYYGTTGTYGLYVSSNMISATLLDYSTLQAVTYKLKMGEKVEQLFLFFDLHPQSAAQNPGFTKDSSNLVFYDTTTDTKVEINLAGFPDQ